MNELYKSQTNRMILGVCGGLGEYFDIDPTLIRLLFLIFAFAGGAAILIYIALAIIMPSREGETNEKIFEESISNARTYVNSVFSTSDNIDIHKRRRNALALAIFLVGLFTLLNNINLFINVNFSLLWPSFIMILGITLFISRKISLGIILFLAIVFIVLSIVFSGTFFHVM